MTLVRRKASAILNVKSKKDKIKDMLQMNRVARPNVASIRMLPIVMAGMLLVVSAYAGGELPMEVQGLQEGRARKVAICTVSSDVAAGLPLKVVRVPKFRHAVEKQENGDGTVTFVADFKPIGFAFVVR